MDGISEILATYNCVSLDEKIQFELDGVVEKEIKQAYCIENLEFCVSCMDYTTLKVSDTEESVKNFTADLLKKLKKFNLRDVAAVCVFSNYAGIVREGLKGTEIQTAVVAGNFPNSQTFTEIKLAECKMDRGFSINGRYCEGNQSFADDKVRYCVNRKTGLSKYSVLFFFIFMFYFQLIFIDVFFFIVNLKKWLCPESTFTDAVLHGQ